MTHFCLLSIIACNNTICNYSKREVTMGQSLTYKLLQQNLITGNLIAGSEIMLKVNQTLTQDSTGTMVYLQLEAMNITKLSTDLSVAYIDHNTLQTGFENADDHEFIKTVCQKYNIIYSKPGNGICHQVHLERFGKPGKVLLGSDSHTPTCGALSMIAIGAGGLDVSIAMATGHYHMKVPKVVNVELVGKLKNGVTSKDVILQVLKTLGVKGAVGAIVEYSGSGLMNLSLTDRATITNMGAELGATTSIFPSDGVTEDFLTRQGRQQDYVALSADEDVKYDQHLLIDLTSIAPLAAKPNSPDNVDSITNIGKIKVDQVAIGSCTNSSFTDLMAVASILKNKKVHKDVSLVIAPGSSNILKMMADNGALGDLIQSGARILEASCGPCIGMGQAPKTNAVSLRTFNRNFKGRCGTTEAQVYLVSPLCAAVSAITGHLTDPTTEVYEPITLPDQFETSDNYFIYPTNESNVTVTKGPNIKDFPLSSALPSSLDKRVLLKLGDNITTDDIVPSGAKVLPYRSNIPKLSEHCFGTVSENFKTLAEEHQGGIVIGGDNYGQGSSREHAALVPLYLGVKAIVAKSFARIHKANLINAGIIPLEFSDSNDYDKINESDTITIHNIDGRLNHPIIEIIVNHQLIIPVTFKGSSRDMNILLKGGYLNYAVAELEVSNV